MLDELYAACFLSEDDAVDDGIMHSQAAIDYALERHTGRNRADRWELEYGERVTETGERMWGLWIAGYATKPDAAAQGRWEAAKSRRAHLCGTDYDRLARWHLAEEHPRDTGGRFMRLAVKKNASR